MANKGFSLIETVITLLIFSVILNIIISSDFINIYRNSYKEDINTLFSLLQHSRKISINNLEQKPHGIFYDDINNNIVLFSGNNYETSDLNERIPHKLSNKLFISNNQREIIFYNISGNSNFEGVLTLDGSNYSILINYEGKIE